MTACLFLVGLARFYAALAQLHEAHPLSASAIAAALPDRCDTAERPTA